MHLSKAKLAGRTLSNLERKPRICGEDSQFFKMRAVFVGKEHNNTQFEYCKDDRILVNWK